MKLMSFGSILLSRLKEVSPLIQIVRGPRQVGKTTTILQLLEDGNNLGASHYVSADAIFRGDWPWIEAQWNLAQGHGTRSILVIDEIQKIEGWSEIIKKLWDESIRSKNPLRVVLLGSSALELQKGLADSLAGRFELLRAYHWNFSEWVSRFGGTLEDYMVYGGYPGAAVHQKDPGRWLDFIQASIVEAVIDKDIMQQTRIARPALFKQVFELC